MCTHFFSFGRPNKKNKINKYHDQYIHRYGHWNSSSGCKLKKSFENSLIASACNFVARSSAAVKQQSENKRKINRSRERVYCIFFVNTTKCMDLSRWFAHIVWFTCIFGFLMAEGKIKRSPAKIQYSYLA